MITKKRILYHYGSSHLDTGSPRALLELVRLVKKMPEYEPVFLMAAPGDLPAAMEASGVETRGPMRVATVSPRAPLRGLQELWKWRRLLKDWKIDLFHLNEIGWNNGAVLTASMLGIPVVLHAHNPAVIHRRNLNRLVADVVLVPSKGLIGEISDRHLLRGGIQVVPNVVDLDRFSSGKSIREDLGLHREDFVILFVGQISHRKGVDLLIEVAKRMGVEGSRAVFLLVGPDAVGEADFGDSMRERVRKGDLSVQIRMLGSREDVPDLMASVDVFFLPTRSEPFGIVFLEAMAAGLPVVGSKVGGVPEVIGTEGDGVMVDAEDVEGYAKALLELERCDRVRTEIGGRAKRRAQTLFGPERIGCAVRQLYQRLLAT